MGCLHFLLQYSCEARVVETLWSFDHCLLDFADALPKDCLFLCQVYYAFFLISDGILL